ncbi:MAG TPA: hypothetical protein DCL43_06040 [Chitinophagaceae bacterium]|jgi:hypothetical protein|nr:hypothetical protein [Chitinophagaceae bacterium]HAN39792.1 hypothetical protein [Chitinophagaceae bacterium]
MLSRLQQKWGVNGWQLVAILTTFALGGSCCGYLGRQVLTLTGVENAFIKWPLYFVLVTLLWPLCVLVVSIPFGQFSFFVKYLKKMFARLSGKKAS